LPGPAVRISSAVFASRIHAFGLRAATSLKPAHSSLIATWCSSTPSPAAARIAVSNIGYTWTGITIWRAISAGWFMTSSSPRMRGTESAGAFGHVSSAPCLRARILVRQASPPVRIARSTLPSAISRAVVLTSVCGVLPPAVV
jgi:hypothetical protein